MMKIITSAVISGVLTVLVWYMVAYIISTTRNMQVSSIIHNPMYFVETTLFITGVLVYLAHVLVKRYRKPKKFLKNKGY